jgi:putative flippase GtrA
MEQRISKKHRGIFKFVKFVFANTIGGIISEIVLLIGLLLIYRNLIIPSNTYSSLTLLELNILAQGIGIAVAFVINEHITVHVDQKNKGKEQLIIRLLKFEGLNGIGSSMGVLVQLLLLGTLSLSPALGNIAGGVVAYPIQYFVSMRFVWRRNNSE